MFSKSSWLFAIIIGACTVTAGAQSYPARPIKLVITMPPGGPTDMLGRALSQKLGDLLPQPVVVENRPGGGGIIAYGIVAKSAPDGYTLLLGDVANSTINPSLNKSLPYDTRKDFTPVALAATSPFYLISDAALPARTLQEFIAYAKGRPGKLSYGSGGTGQLTHIAPELFKMKNGLNIVHVPYKGAAPALFDVVAGRVAFVMTAGLAMAKPHLEAGKVRVLAVTGDARSASVPDVPTFAEAGAPMPEMRLGTWWGVLGPAAMPRNNVAKLAESVAKAQKAPDFLARLSSFSMDPMVSTPESFGEIINSGIETWAQVVKPMNITLD